MQRLHALGVFDEQHFGSAGAQVADQIGERVAGVERAGDGPGGHDADVDQVKLGAGLGVHRDDVAFPDADGMKSAGDFLGGLDPLLPGETEIFPFPYGLMQGVGVGVGVGGLFEDREDSTGIHRFTTNVA